VTDPIVLALDIGGTKIAAARVSSGRVLDRREVPTPAREGPQAVVQAALDLLADWCTDAVALGVASGGVIHDGRVVLSNPKILPGWTGLDLGGIFRSATGLPVRVLNDAQAAAWGEYRYGAARGLRSVAFVTVSTGVGAGLVIDGRLVTGRTGLAGHLGHTQVDPHGEVCGCGRVGCVETVASGTALVRMAQAVFGAALDPRALFERAATGDVRGIRIVEAAVQALVQALGNLQALVDPELMILGGGIGQNPFYRACLLRALRTLPEPFRPHLGEPLLGADAGLVGAAAWATP
jgi:N-acylmannosamine kinase